MRRRTRMLAYGVALLSFCTLGAVYVFTAMVPSKSTEPPLPHTQQQRTSELLFFIPYGEQDIEIYIEPATGPGEGDGIGQTTPVAFRRLADGNLMIVGGRKGGLAAQVFDQSGKLVRFVRYEWGMPDHDLLYLTGDGSLYILRRILFDNRAINSGIVVQSDSTDVQDIDVQGNPVPEQPAEHPSYLVIFDPDGKRNGELASRFIEQLVELVNNEDFDSIGGGLAVTTTGEVLVEYATPVQPEGYALVRLARLRTSGEKQTLTAPGRPPIRLYDGSIGYLQASPREEGDSEQVSEVRIVREDVSVLARFKIPVSVREKGRVVLGDYSTPDPILVSPNRLALLVCDYSYDDNGYKSIEKVRGVRMWRQYLIVLDPSGEVVFEEPIMTVGEMQHLCDTDGKGNLYYLNFTNEGVEVRRVSLTR
jgi:hypothetical protein